MNWQWDSILVAARYLGLTALLSVCLALVLTALYGIARTNDSKRPKVTYVRAVADALPYIIAITLIGGLCGQLGGGSRDSVVESLLPAILGGFGSFAAYYLGAKRDRGGKVAVNTLAFLIGFFALYNVSAVWRQDSENWKFCRDLYSTSDFATLQDRDAVTTYWSGYCGPLFNTWTRRAES